MRYQLLDACSGALQRERIQALGLRWKMFRVTLWALTNAAKEPQAPKLFLKSADPYLFEDETWNLLVDGR